MIPVNKQVLNIKKGKQTFCGGKNVNKKFLRTKVVYFLIITSLFTFSSQQESLAAQWHQIPVVKKSKQAGDDD